jgi:hypothetical protein
MGWLNEGIADSSFSGWKRARTRGSCRALRQGSYSTTMFHRRCGASLDVLWREFVAQSEK